MMKSSVEIRHFHLFCGLGGAARGMNRAKVRLDLASRRVQSLPVVQSSTPDGPLLSLLEVV